MALHPLLIQTTRTPGIFRRGVTLQFSLYHNGPQKPFRCSVTSFDTLRQPHNIEVFQMQCYCSCHYLLLSKRRNIPNSLLPQLSLSALLGTQKYPKLIVTAVVTVSSSRNIEIFQTHCYRSCHSKIFSWDLGACTMLQLMSLCNPFPELYFFGKKFYLLMFPILPRFN